jgi:hypothetical protein
MSNGTSQSARTWGEWFRGHLVLAILVGILLQLVEGWYYGRDLERRLTTVEIELHHLQATQEPAHK